MNQVDPKIARKLWGGIHMKKSNALSGTALALIAAALASPVLIAGPAYAQTADAPRATNAAGAEEIIVTARRQSESLQDVPVVVSAIGRDTLETYQVNEIADVVSRIPALNVQVGGSGAGGQISLRGIGTTNISAAFDSAVAFNFDDVQVSTMRIVQAAFFDVEQVDLLKGPQSLFFGKSASAGVLSVRSANPTSTWTSGVNASYEFEEDGRTVGGFVSGPLTDTLGIRVALQYQDIIDFVEQEPGARSEQYGDSKGLTNTIGRVTLQWDPTERFSANLKLNYNHYDAETLLGHSDLSCGRNGIADPIFLLGGAIQIRNNATCNTDDGLYPTTDAHPSIRRTLPGTTGFDRLNANNGGAYNETETTLIRLNMSYDLTENLQLSSVTGYFDLKNEHLDSFGYAGVLPNGRAGGLPAPFSDAVEQVTQEFRLTSDFDGRFNFMIGAFYETRDIPLTTSQNALAISLAAGPDPFTGSTFDWYAERTTETEAQSAFISATYDLTDRIELAGGIRYSKEEKEHVIAFPYVHAAIGTGAVFLRSGFRSGVIRFEDSNWSPEFTVRYRVNDDINIYGAYKTGFKSGGIDTSALPTNSLNGLNSSDPAVRAAAEDALIYDSETAKGFEFGVKSQFPDSGLTINGAVYHYVFDNLQVQNFNGRLVQFFTSNASELTSQGVEVDVSWRTPVEGLQITGALAYTDTTYTDTFNPLGTFDLNGRASARAPEWSGNIGFNWIIPATDTLEWGFGGNASYSGEYYAAASAADNYLNPSYTTLDLSASFGRSDGRWKFSVVGVNVTDELWVNTSGNRPFLSPTGDDEVRTQNRGRQIFVETALRF
jgi:iron complex outermembrane receptor protein